MEDLAPSGISTPDPDDSNKSLAQVTNKYIYVLLVYRNYVSAVECTCLDRVLYSTDHLASLSRLPVRCPCVLISSSPQHEVGSSNSLWECRGDKSFFQPTAHRDRHTGSPLLLTSPPSFISTPLPLSAPEGKQHNTL